MRDYNKLIDESRTAPDYIIYKWVCMFHQRSGANKILRNVVPTYVAVFLIPIIIDWRNYIKKEKYLDMNLIELIIAIFS